MSKQKLLTQEEEQQIVDAICAEKKYLWEIRVHLEKQQS
jgi:hypothetical protein